MIDYYDILIAGAGPVGCTIAERLAQKDLKVLIVEKRNHIGGNCYDCYHNTGVLIHRYGPHYFRTNNKVLIDYLSQFTEWLPGNYIVKSYVLGQLFPFPINLTTLEKFYHRSFTTEEAEKYLDMLKVPNPEPANSEEFVLSRIGHELYMAFYYGYTLKQWGKSPRELAPSVCGRIPIRYNRDPRYVDHKYQVIPANGYTKMFEKMVNHKNIKILLQTDFMEIRGHIRPKIATVYTGPIDAYFDYVFGKLPWRSLDFDFRTYSRCRYKQSCVQINYPNDYDYTRTVEIKHITQQRHEDTIVAYEYPKSQGDPYYPVPAKENDSLFLKYNKLAEKEHQESRVYFAGRLAEYKYINMDEAFEKGLLIAEKILTDLYRKA
jgi:UDP-galactopyranose mutase